jgi:hypothetical protein
MSPTGTPEPTSTETVSCAEEHIKASLTEKVEDTTGTDVLIEPEGRSVSSSKIEESVLLRYAPRVLPARGDESTCT